MLFMCLIDNTHPVQSRLRYLVTENHPYIDNTTFRNIKVNSFYIPHAGNSGKSEDNKVCFHIQYIKVISLCTHLKTENEDTTYQFVITNLHPIFSSNEFVSIVKKKKNLCSMCTGIR